MYEASGPRKKIDYSKPSGDEEDEVTAYDLANQEFNGYEYKVQHKGEKFSLFPKARGREEEIKLSQEERELAEALAKIKEMEELEKVTSNDQNLLEYLKQGGYVYELYAVLVHSGSAMGGHYYAYIKSNEDGLWYNFNDTSVSEISPDEIPKVFGDSSGSSGGTAYMLKYRQYNPADKECPLIVSDELVPSYLKEEIDAETDKLIKEQLEIEEKVMSLKLRIHCNDEMKQLTFKKNDELRVVAARIMEEFGLQEVALMNFRLRAYDPKLKARLNAYDHWDFQLHKLLFHNYMDLLVEIKSEGETFAEFNPDTLFLRVLKYVEDQKYEFGRPESLPAQVIQVDRKHETVEMLDKRLAEMFDIPQERLVVLLRHEHIYNNSVRTELYNIDWRKAKTIEDASRLDHGAVLFVEEADPGQQFDTLRWNIEFAKE